MKRATVKPNLLDRTIGWFAPQAATKRLSARARWLRVRGGYQGATKSHRGARWRKLGSGSASDALLLPDLATLRERSREFIRNNGWAAKAQDVVASHTVGLGITPRVLSAGPRKLGRGRKDQLSRAVRQALETPELDVTGELDLYGLQDQVMAAVFESGEVLVRRRWRSKGGFPLQIQVLEPEFLDTSKDTRYAAAGGNRIIAGIEYDQDGRKVAYWLHPDHPNDMYRPSLRGESVRVPASEVLHIGEKRRRPGQTRFVPWLSPVILDLGDFDEYEDAVLTRQKLSNAYVGVIYDDSDAADPAEDGEEETEEGNQVDPIEPGTWEKLGPGQKIEFSNPPSAPDHPSYARSQLLKIAAAVGITYESLTGDLRSTNYSSGRLGRMEMDRNVGRWQRGIMVAQFLDPLARWILEALELTGANVGGVKIGWTPPPRIVTDPSKEVPARIRSIRAGLKSMPEALREEGRDPQEALDEIREWNEQVDEAGVVLDTDPRHVAYSGVSAGLAEVDDDKDDPPSANPD